VAVLSILKSKQKVQNLKTLKRLRSSIPAGENVSHLQD